MYVWAKFAFGALDAGQKSLALLALVSLGQNFFPTFGYNQNSPLGGGIARNGWPLGRAYPNVIATAPR